MSEDHKDKTVGTVNLHIGNGGVNISVINTVKDGPLLVISSEHHGNNVDVRKVHLHPSALPRLAKLFTDACNETYNGLAYNAAQDFDDHYKPKTTEECEEEARQHAISLGEGD